MAIRRHAVGRVALVFFGLVFGCLVSSVFYGDGMACDRRFSTRRWMCCVAMVLVVSGECRFAQVDGFV